jgi:biopolymer transport protein ExbD
MAMNVGGGGEGEAYSDINMTPLIDIMLVLLIIFIITIPVMTHAVKIDNPPPNNNPPPVDPVVVNIGIDFDGTLLWNGTAVDRKTMQGYITQEAGNTPQPEVHIKVDKFAKYEIVAQTLADLQSRGLKKIGFVNNELF